MSLDYSQDIDAQLTENWIKHRFLKNIPKKRVIVIDSAQLKLFLSYIITKEQTLKIF